MIISQHQINLQSSHQQQLQVSERESLQTIHSNAAGELSVSVIQSATSVSLSQRAQTLIQRLDANPASGVATPAQAQSAAGAEKQDPGSTELPPRLRLLAALISAMFGVKIEILGQDIAPAANPEGETADPAPPSPVPAAPRAPMAALSGVRYEYQRDTTLEESTQFSAQGRIVTADGRELNVDLALAMEYRYRRSESLVLSAGVQLKDPLVINFSGSAAELSAEKLSFDLDADGRAESFHFVTSQSGLLTLDLNQDGRVNDGRELFGALSGDGFADLAQYDEDRNGFIDEGDSVYGRLKIWIRSDGGTDQFATLQEKGIGALYLGAIDTPLSLYGADDGLGGAIKATGLFVREEGAIGTLQQIDLVV